MSPGLSVLCWSHVTRSDLLSCWDVEPRLYLDQSLPWIVLTDRVTPRSKYYPPLCVSLSLVVCLHAGMVEKSLHGIHGQTTAMARRKVQEGPVGGLYSKCVLQVRQPYSGVLKCLVLSSCPHTMRGRGTTYQTEYVVVNSGNVEPH